MKLHRLALVAIAAGALAACVGTPTPYGPAGPNGHGFREQRVETDRYIVTFTGNGSTSRGTVADLALRRAADLTLTEGYDWFEVVGRTDTAGPGGRGSSVGVGVGGVSGGRGSSVGTSVGVSLPLGGSTGSTTTSLEVKMGRGEHPMRPSVYDAREVSQNLATVHPG